MATEFHLLFPWSLCWQQLIKGPKLKAIFDQVWFTKRLKHLHQDLKGVTTAAYGIDFEKSRNPLIQHSSSMRIIPSVTFFLFFLFSFLSCFPFICAQFQSVLLFKYKGCSSVLNVASGQQAFCKDLVYTHRRMFFSLSFMMFCCK